MRVRGVELVLEGRAVRGDRHATPPGSLGRRGRKGTGADVPGASQRGEHVRSLQCLGGRNDERVEVFGLIVPRSAHGEARRVSAHRHRRRRLQARRVASERKCNARRCV